MFHVNNQEIFYGPMEPFPQLTACRFIQNAIYMYEKKKLIIT